MSEPLSTPDIEDVVSSVRRLVSTTLSPRVKTRDLAHDKLLLTPSLRVVPEMVPEPEPPVAEVAPVAEAAAPEIVVADLVPEAPFIEVEAADAPSEAISQLVEAEWEDELWTADDAPLAELAAGVEDAEIVVASEPMPEPVPEPVADAWPEVAATPDPWAQAEPDWVEEAPIPFVPLPRVAATVAEPATVAVAQDVATPEVAEMTGEAAVTVAAEPSPTDPPLADAAAATEPTLFDAEGSPIAILDEEELNEVVRALIREELQGALGERITRNVRKLVRAEINRALAARAFD